MGGPDGLVAEAGDILNDLLLKLTREARRCTAPDDNRALAWLCVVTTRMVEYEAKTARRRFWLLVDRLRSQGYYHESWESRDNRTEQEGDDDLAGDKTP